MPLQLEAHVHQDVDGHQGLAGVLDVFGPKTLSHQLVPFLSVQCHCQLRGRSTGKQCQPKGSLHGRQCQLKIQKQELEKQAVSVQEAGSVGSMSAYKAGNRQ